MIAENVPFVIKKASDESVVFSGETSSVGKANIALPPGNYLLEVGAYAGYAVETITKQESGGTVYEYESPVAPIPFTISEDAVTTSTVDFISNAI